MEENTSKLKCQLCDRVFDGLDLLNLHLRVAHNLKNRVGNSVLSVMKFNCDTCKKSFSTNGMLSRHVESKICQKSFPKIWEHKKISFSATIQMSSEWNKIAKKCIFVTKMPNRNLWEKKKFFIIIFPFHYNNMMLFSQFSCIKRY